jgi:hypothetical protein
MGRYGSRTDLMVHGSQNYQCNISGMYQEGSNFRQRHAEAEHVISPISWAINGSLKGKRGSWKLG